MHRIHVGQPLVEGQTRWPEAGEFNLYDNGLELRLFFRGLSKAEVRGVEQGESRFALVAEGDLLFFLYRFADLP